MRLLLDTHAVLWQLSNERRLPEAAQEAILAADELLVSTVLFAEIGIKPEFVHLRGFFERAVR